ncbi:MAG: hypothetical protein IZT55_03225 [Anaerolineae bacterium]|nr:hypothetical protein [Anaerolineae bacterium]
MKKGNITGGLILILIGAWFLAVQFVPGMRSWVTASWPLSIIGIGAIFLIAAVASNVPGLAIPAFIIGGIGSLLFYQDATGDWQSWAYAWTFIPGFVGLGLLFFSLLAKDKGASKAGMILIFISTVLFMVFGSFLGAPGEIIRYWPLLLIGLGAWSITRSLFRKKTSNETEVV